MIQIIDLSRKKNPNFFMTILRIDGKISGFPEIFMKRFLFVLVLLFFFTGTAFSLNVSVVDVQKALNECEAGKSAKQILEKTMQVKKEIIERKKAELEKLRKELSKKDLKESERSKKEAMYETKVKELQNFIGKAQEEVSAKTSEYQNNILKGLIDTIKKIAEQKKIDLVIEAHSGIIYFKPTMDLTDEVVKKYNKATQKKR